MSDYQNKRKQLGASQQNLAGISKIAETQKEDKLDDDDDYNDDFGDDDNDWGDFLDKPDVNNLDNFDYRNANLNKCSDRELKQHKAKMDQHFNQN